MEGGGLHAVGVVQDVKYTGADQPARPMIFLPDFQIPVSRDADGNVMACSMLLRTVSVNTTRGAGAPEPQFRQAAGRVDPNVTDD